MTRRLLMTTRKPSSAPPDNAMKDLDRHSGTNQHRCILQFLTALATKRATIGPPLTPSMAGLSNGRGQEDYGFSRSGFD